MPTYARVQSNYLAATTENDIRQRWHTICKGQANIVCEVCRRGELRRISARA
jgi:hypothetical protein